MNKKRRGGQEKRARVAKRGGHHKKGHGSMKRGTHTKQGVIMALGKICLALECPDIYNDAPCSKQLKCDTVHEFIKAQAESNNENWEHVKKLIYG